MNLHTVIFALCLVMAFGVSSLLYTSSPTVPVAEAVETPPTAPVIPPALALPPDPLLDSICFEESIGEPVRPWAVNPTGSAWGICQVKYWSAVHYGGFDEQARQTGVPSRSPGELFNHDTNRGIARGILQHCRGRYPGRSNQGLAYCYYAGPNSQLGSNTAGVTYGRVVAGRLKIDLLNNAEALRSIQWIRARMQETVLQGSPQ